TSGSYNEVQRVRWFGGPSSGTFQLTLSNINVDNPSNQTANIDINATHAQVVAALEALDSVPAGSVIVHAAPGGGFDIEFTGALTGRNIETMSVATNFDSGGAQVSTAGQGQLKDPTDDAFVVTVQPEIDKSIISTSEPSTTVDNTTTTATIGEIVRYQIRVRLPGGTTEDIEIVDRLPNGLTFIDDGTATLSFQADDVSNLSGDLSVGALPDSAVSRTGNASNDDRFATGTDVRFRLQDLHNAEVDDSNAEYALIQFNVLVDNSTRNNGTSRNHSGNIRRANATELTFENMREENGSTSPLTVSSQPPIRIVEPRVSISKSVSPGGDNDFNDSVVADGGDLLDYRVDLSAANGRFNSTAHHVQLIDDNLGDQTLDTASVVVKRGSTVLVAGVDYVDNSTSDKLDIVLTKMEKNDAVRVEYSTTVDSTATPNKDVESTAVVRWDSVPNPGGTAVSTTADPTGNPTGTSLGGLDGVDTSDSSPTSGHQGIIYDTDRGTIQGPRIGVINTNGNINNNNDYVARETTTLETQPVRISKTLDSTSINDPSTHDNNERTQAVIGEIATYTITLDVSEGIVPNSSIVDTLDQGLVFVEVTNTSVAGTTLDGTVDLTNPTVSNNGRTLTWDLKTITDNTNVNANNSAGTRDGDPKITITYTAVVTNIALNQSGQQQNNTATFSFDDDPTQAPNPRQSTSATSEQLTIIEPVVTVTSKFDLDTDGDGQYDDGTVGDGADDVQFTITITNASGVDAFDAALATALPKFANGSSVVRDAVIHSYTDSATSAGIPQSDFELVGTNGTGFTLQSVSGADIDLTANDRDSNGDPRTITIVVRGTVDPSVSPNVAYAEQSQLTWQSIDGTLGDVSSHTTDDTKRTGADGVPSSTALNDYATTTAASFSVDAARFTKHLIGTNQSETDDSDGEVTIGEIITYGLLVDLPNASIAGMDIVDLLPQGLKYVDSEIVTDHSDARVSSLISKSFAGTFVDALPTATTSSNSTTNGTNVNFDFGRINVTDDGDMANKAFVIVVRAQVENVSTNHGYTGNQTTLSNNATLDFDGDSVVAVSVLNTVDLKVVEPNLSITKEFGTGAANVDVADAGDMMIIVLTVDNTTGLGDAHDVTIQDQLNAAHYDLSSVMTSGMGTSVPAGFTVNYNSNTGLLQFTGGSIAAKSTAQFVFTAKLKEDVTPNATLENTATIENVSTLQGSVMGERSDTDPDDNDNDTDKDTVRIRRNRIEGFVFNDADNDGVKDSGESGLANVTVRIEGVDHLGNAITPFNVNTDSNGFYRFDNLPPGEYTIIEDPAGSTVPSSLLDGKDQIDTSGTGSGTPGNDRYTNVTLTAGQETTATGFNFAEISPASLTGFVFHDANNDGDPDLGESGVGGFEVRLRGKDDLGQSVDLLATTNSTTGEFVFQNLRPSDAAGYQIVKVTTPTGYLDGKDIDAADRVFDGRDAIGKRPIGV
ncbi:MAG: isopeptide-forming domain-containing fimbrial protein, partial [Planctomycetota bacterium]